MTTRPSRILSAVRVCFSFVVTASPCVAFAQAPIPPRAHIAAPDIYKVLAEGHQQRVLMATLKPGQVSPPVSHPLGTVVYYVTDCSMKFTADGMEMSTFPVAGSARFVASNIVQRVNTGKSDCKMVFVERE